MGTKIKYLPPEDGLTRCPWGMKTLGSLNVMVASEECIQKCGYFQEINFKDNTVTCGHEGKNQSYILR